MLRLSRKVIMRGMRFVLLCMALVTLFKFPATAHATKALDAKGPWLLFQSTKSGDANDRLTDLWVTNLDGSGRAQIAKGAHISNLTIANVGGYFAYIASGNNNGVATKPVLNVLQLPRTTSQFQLSLTKAATEPTFKPEGPALNAEQIFAITVLTSLAWSPDGTTLAFIGAQNGTSADLYTFSTKTKNVARLTDGPSQANRPSWSPDGKHIVHIGVNGFGTGAGYNVEGVWAARADNSSVKALYKPSLPYTGDEVIIGWKDPQTFVTYTWTADIGPVQLRTYNIINGESQMLREKRFDEAVFNLKSGRVLIVIDQQPSKGIFLLDGVSEPKLISADSGQNIEAALGTSGFVINHDSYVTENGDVRDLPCDNPQVSTDGQHWVWLDVDYLMVGGPLCSHPVRLLPREDAKGNIPSWVQ